MLNQNSEPNQSPIVLGNKSHYSKIQLIGFSLVRGGVICASFCSVILINGLFFHSWDYYENNFIYLLGMFTMVIGSTFAIISLVIGFFMSFLGGINSKISLKTQLMGVIMNPHIYIIISIILANWALILIPGCLFLPLTLIDSEFGILISGQRGWLFPYTDDVHSLERVGESPSLITFIAYYLDSPDWNIFLGSFRLIGLVLFLMTIGYLVYHLLLVINRREELQVMHSQLLVFLELEFLSVLVGMLIFEALPLWEFFDPKAVLVVSMVKFVYLCVTPQVSLFFVIFLSTGNISQPFFVINNLDNFKNRLVYSISLMVFSSIIFWLLYLFPIYLQ